MFFLEGSFYSFFYIFNRKAEIWEKLLFLNWSSPQVVHISYIVHNHDFLYHLGAILKKKKKLFSNFSLLVKDKKKRIKHHFLSMKNPWVIKISRAYLNRTATPWRSSKLKWRGGRSFWATTRVGKKVEKSWLGLP